MVIMEGSFHHKYEKKKKLKIFILNIKYIKYYFWGVLLCEKSATNSNIDDTLPTFQAMALFLLMSSLTALNIVVEGSIEPFW